MIAEPDERYEAYCKSSDFIREHIFPGGCTWLGGSWKGAGMGKAGRESTTACQECLAHMKGRAGPVLSGLFLAEVCLCCACCDGSLRTLLPPPLPYRAGGHLPCMGVMVDSARGTGMRVHGCQDIGPDYAVTLRAWRDAWEARKEEVRRRGCLQWRVCIDLCDAVPGSKISRCKDDLLNAPHVPLPLHTRRCWPWATRSASGASTSFTLPTARPPLTHGMWVGGITVPPCSLAPVDVLGGHAARSSSARLPPSATSLPAQLPLPLPQLHSHLPGDVGEGRAVHPHAR